MLLNQGVELMVYGMGTVVLFLSLLVLATQGMSAALLRWFPEPEPVPEQPAARPAIAPAGDGDISPELVAAITTAVMQHRASSRTADAPGSRT